MKIDPLGSKSETLIGRVVAVHEIDLTSKLDINPGSIGANFVIGNFPGLQANQITMLVDEIDIDPDAEDLLSYTFWCPISNSAQSVRNDDIIKVEIEPVNVLLESERHWVARSLKIQ